MAIKGRYNDAKHDLLHAIWDALSTLNGKTVDQANRVTKAGFSTVTEDLLSEIYSELADFGLKYSVDQSTKMNLVRGVRYTTQLEFFDEDTNSWIPVPITTTPVNNKFGYTFPFLLS